jgi:hypothetical protein
VIDADDHRHIRERVLAFVRGDDDVAALEAAGLDISMSNGGVSIREPGGTPIVTPTRRDVATGMVASYARGTLQEWARLLLAAHLIDLVETENEPDELFLNALWNAAECGDLSDVALAQARTLAEA